MKSRAGSTAPNEPSTDAEWREAVDTAYAAVLVDAAVRLGLLGLGPRIDLRRCRQFLRRGKGWATHPGRTR